MAISVLVAVDPVGDELVAKIGERVAKLTRRARRRGRLRDGPAGHQARTGTRSPRYLDAGVADGATLAVDGRRTR